MEITAVVLKPGERAPQVPDETQRVPLELKAKGFLQTAASVGDDVEIRTVTGRLLSGRLTAALPAYEHSFGKPIEALLTIGQELRAIVDAPDETP